MQRRGIVGCMQRNNLRGRWTIFVHFGCEVKEPHSKIMQAVMQNSTLWNVGFGSFGKSLCNWT